MTEPETRGRRWRAWAAAAVQPTEPETRARKWLRILGAAACLTAGGVFWLSDGEGPWALWATWSAVAAGCLLVSQAWRHPAFLAGGVAVGAYWFGGPAGGVAGALLGGALLAWLWPTENSRRAAYAAGRAEHARGEETPD